MVRNLLANAGDIGDTRLIPRWRRPPGVGNSSIQYSWLGNPMTEETGGLKPVGLPRVRHDLATEQ